MGHTRSITTWLHFGLIFFIHGCCGMIPSCKEVEILGVAFQCDSKCSVHVKNKLIKANKSLHILRTLRKEGYNQSEIDLLFNTIVLPNINYALSVYAASESDLTPVQCFLDRCFKRKYTSKPVSVYDFLERQDRKIFKKVSNSTGHPLLSIMPCVKLSGYHLRIMHFKNIFPKTRDSRSAFNYTMSNNGFYSKLYFTMNRLEQR